ncbi:MAG: translational GTPase TypA [Acholeplasmatales bacterium]|jgi:GTP-binding protein|nr:translational GTPase TypA [Acholeplasmatales bacterium]
MKIKNVAIIAHVDHGKTTLVDKLLKQSHAIKDYQVVQERALDSNDLERERGITILAKNTAINYKDYKINILDTPGHADFGGEVERIMSMVDGALLLVDAVDGVMPQTKFVLRKALEANVKPIVVINKVDREFSDPKRVINEVFDLFIDLNANDEQMEFPIIYASGLQGYATLNADLSEATDLTPIFETIIKYVPDPINYGEDYLLFQSALVDYSDYVGRIGIGLVSQGKLKPGEIVTCLRLDGSSVNFRIQKLFQYFGLSKSEVDLVETGDIAGISGLPDLNVGETVTTLGFTKRLDILVVDEPTVKISFLTNNSPLAGKEGKFVTASKIEDRLFKEAKKDVALRVERSGTKEEWVVCGRGELHLGILIENMRREGYEFQISRPQVITKVINSKVCEPFEEVQIDCSIDVMGDVMNMIGDRKGELVSMHQNAGYARINYIMSSRGLIGLQTLFLTITKGYGVLNHTFLDYRPWSNYSVGERVNGALVSMLSGLTTTYALHHLEDRGIMFLEPRVEVYEGMIVGMNNKDNDLVVNCVQEKQQTNMRSSSKDTTIVLRKNLEMSLEKCISFINEDELIEITPKSIRLRKLYLTSIERKRNNKNYREEQ